MLCLCTRLLSLAGLQLLDFAGQVFVADQEFPPFYKRGLRRPILAAGLEVTNCDLPFSSSSPVS